MTGLSILIMTAGQCKTLQAVLLQHSGGRCTNVFLSNLPPLSCGVLWYQNLIQQHSLAHLQAQDLVSARTSDDGFQLTVPTPMSEVHPSSQEHQMSGLPPKSPPLWAPTPRRQPISLGLSLKQQVSSPRYAFYFVVLVTANQSRVKLH